VTSPLPLVPYLKIPDNGSPTLEGRRCSNCSATFTDVRMHCAACGGRDCLDTVKLARTGKLHAFSVIYRSFPEVKVPYVSAVVDLDGGGTLKANLVGINPDPDRITVGMSVELVFHAAEQRDEEGREYLVYAFQPAGTR